MEILGLILILVIVLLARNGDKPVHPVAYLRVLDRSTGRSVLEVATAIEKQGGVRTPRTEVAETLKLLTYEGLVESSVRAEGDGHTLEYRLTWAGLRTRHEHRVSDEPPWWTIRPT